MWGGEDGGGGGGGGLWGWWCGWVGDGWWMVAYRTIQFLHKCDVVVSPTYTDTIDLFTQEYPGQMRSNIYATDFERFFIKAIHCLSMLVVFRCQIW